MRRYSRTSLLNFFSTADDGCGSQIVIVMDNTSFHHSEKIVQISADAGVKLVYLPPYSPDLNTSIRLRNSLLVSKALSNVTGATLKMTLVKYSIFPSNGVQYQSCCGEEESTRGNCGGSVGRGGG